MAGRNTVSQPEPAAAGAGEPTPQSSKIDGYEEKIRRIIGALGLENEDEILEHLRNLTSDKYELIQGIEAKLVQLLEADAELKQLLERKSIDRNIYEEFFKNLAKLQGRILVRRIHKADTSDQIAQELITAFDNKIKAINELLNHEKNTEPTEVSPQEPITAATTPQPAAADAAAGAGGNEKKYYEKYLKYKNKYLKLQNQ